MKLFRSLKVRFILLFGLFVVTLCVVNGILSIHQLTSIASEIFAAQGIYVAEKAASLIDGDSFEALAKSLDEEDPFYEETRLKMLELKEFSNCRFLYTMAPAQGTTWRFIIDGSVPPEDTDNFSSLGDEEDTSDYDPAFEDTWQTQKTEYSSIMFQGKWGWMVSIYAPVKNSSGKPVGLVGCDFAAEGLYNAIKDDIIKQSFITIISILIAFGLMVILLRMIFGRLHNINTILKEISAGEGDLTKRIHIHREDEIGELATNFNLSLDKIRGLIVAIKDEAGHLLNIGGELADNMEGTAGAVRDIAQNITNVKEKITIQSASVTQTSSAMEHVTVNIDRLNRNVEMQTASVSQSSSAVEEMVANIQSVTQTLMKNGENVNELITVSDVGRTGLQAVSRDIQEIARESEGLLEINEVMQSISSQTNLLSMNAAIEAAHAGEAGKGFAVVADEIRKLAENSGEQSKTISSVLQKIKTSIDTITVSTNTVLEKFGAIDGRVRIVSDQET
ncbi:MAG: methyl-accepting chemotaxis protein, partial [Spirochaetales bacterium]|nr:methyl-accepting chemotaxis protein [Spirochaetales bacterium]